MAYLEAKDAIQEYRLLTRKVLEAWKIQTPHLDTKTKTVSYTYGSFTDADIERMLEDKKFYAQSYERLMNEIKLARSFMKDGFSEGVPWFARDGNHPLDICRGLAAMRPETVQDDKEASIVYKPYRALDDPNLWLRVSDSKISIGTENKPSSSIAVGLWRLGKKAMSPPVEDTLLASQQLGIQKWGSIELHGNSRFIRKSLDVALAHGTWQHITNPELQSEINARVRQMSDADRLWTAFSDIPLRKDIPARELDAMLFNANDVMLKHLKKAMEEGTLKNPGLDTGKLQAMVAAAGSMSREAHGDFLNAVIASRNGTPGMEYDALLRGFKTVLAANPEIARHVRDEIEERAALRNLITDIPRGSVTKGAEQSLNPVLALSGIDENSIYDMKNRLDEVDRDALSPEMKEAFNAVMARIDGLAAAMDGDTTQAKQKLVRENSTAESISMQLHEFGIDFGHAPDFFDKNNPACVNNERYVSNEPVSIDFMDHAIITPKDSDNSYEFTKTRIASGEKPLDILVVRQSGDDEPLAVIWNDKEKNQSIAVGCATHPGPQDSELSEILANVGDFSRLLSDEQETMKHSIMENEELLQRHEQELKEMPAPEAGDAPGEKESPAPRP